MAEVAEEVQEQPTTGLIVIGDAMIFKPNSMVLQVTITERSHMATCVTADLDSLETLHIIVKANNVMDMYDPDSITKFMPHLKENAEVTVHVLENPGSEHMDIVKMSLVLAGLRVECETDASDGTKTVTAMNDMLDS